MRDETNSVFWQVFVAKTLPGGNNSFVVYLNKDVFFTYLTEFRQRQIGGAKINWLRSQILEMCEPELYFVDYIAPNTNPSQKGNEFVSQMLVTIWSKPVTPANVCGWLENNPL